MLKRLTEKRVKTFWGYDCNIEKMEKLINDFIDCDKELDSVQLLAGNVGIITYHLRAGIWYFVKVGGAEMHAFSKESVRDEYIVELSNSGILFESAKGTMEAYRAGKLFSE